MVRVVPMVVVLLLLLVRRIRMGGLLREGSAALDAARVIGSSAGERHFVQGHNAQGEGAATTVGDAAAVSNAVATAAAAAATGRGPVQSNSSSSSRRSRSRDALERRSGLCLDEAHLPGGVVEDRRGLLQVLLLLIVTVLVVLVVVMLVGMLLLLLLLMIMEAIALIHRRCHVNRLALGTT